MKYEQVQLKILVGWVFLQVGKKSENKAISNTKDIMLATVVSCFL